MKKKVIDLQNIVYFDTETTGLPPKGANCRLDYQHYPDIVQFAWIFKGKEKNYLIRPQGWSIPAEATAVHGITQEIAEKYGWKFEDVIGDFIKDISDADMICGHNITFDCNIIIAMVLRMMGSDFLVDNHIEELLDDNRRIDTMLTTIKFVGAKYANGKVGKFPKLEELYYKLFEKGFAAHNAIDDVRACMECVPALIGKGILNYQMAATVKENNEKNDVPNDNLFSENFDIF